MVRSQIRHLATFHGKASPILYVHVVGYACLLGPSYMRGLSAEGGKVAITTYYISYLIIIINRYSRLTTPPPLPPPLFFKVAGVAPFPSIWRVADFLSPPIPSIWRARAVLTMGSVW